MIPNDSLFRFPQTEISFAFEICSLPCGTLSSRSSAQLHAETKNTRERNGQFRYMLSYTVKRKNDLIWLNFKIRSGVAGGSQVGLDCPEARFKGTLALSERFGRFFGPKFLIGHFGRTLKSDNFQSKLNFKCIKCYFSTFLSIMLTIQLNVMTSEDIC